MADDKQATTTTSARVSQALAARFRRRYLVVEDDAAVGRSLKSVFDRWGDATVARGGRDAHAAIRAQAWTAILIDLRQPHDTGLDVLADLRTFRPAVPVLVLAREARPATVNRACELGATLAIKPVPRSLLEAFIRSLRWPDERLAQAVDRWRVVCRLSEAERDVLFLAATGATRSEIAATRKSSPLTVKKHCERILKKTGERSWHEAVGKLLREAAEAHGWDTPIPVAAHSPVDRGCAPVPGEPREPVSFAGGSR